SLRPPISGKFKTSGDLQSAMGKAITEIRSLARSHTRTALNVLVAVMRNTKATPPARVAAANAILDRGWGKPTQALANDENQWRAILWAALRRVVSLRQQAGSTAPLRAQPAADRPIRCSARIYRTSRR